MAGAQSQMGCSRSGYGGLDIEGQAKFGIYSQGNMGGVGSPVLI